MDVIVIHVLNALLYSSVLFLIAGGLSLIYGVMRILNLAHGNLYALGAFVSAWAIGLATGPNTPSVVFFLLLPVGAIAAAIAGAVIERTLLRPFYKRPEEYQLLMTFGLLMILEDVIRFIWGPAPLTATSVYASLGSIPIGDGRYPTYNLVIIGVGIVAAVFLWAFIYKTRFGVLLRATSQDKRMASALGVGVDALVLAFIVVVIGGLGSLEGALAGALIVGVVREFFVTMYPEVELAVLYLIAAFVLLVRPAGLFGRA